MRLLLASIACALVAVAVRVSGQSSSEPIAFDAAVMKKSSLSDGSSWALQPSGDLIVRGVSIYDLLKAALYQPGAPPPEGGPTWLNSERVDVAAKAPAKTSFDGIRPMLLHLLVEHCKLAFHREQRTRAVYALLVGSQGNKLQESAGEGRARCDMSRTPEGLERESCRNTTLEELSVNLANTEAHDIDREVVNLTGLTGVYDFTLEWRRWRAAGQGATGAGPPDEPLRVTLLDALRKLGMRLETVNCRLRSS